MKEMIARNYLTAARRIDEDVTGFFFSTGVRGKVPADKEMEYILCGVWYRLPVHGVHPACGS